MASTSLILHMLIKLKSICKTFMLLYVALFAVPTANCQPNQNCSIIYAAIHWTLILSTLLVGDSGKWPENRKRNIWTPLMHFDPEFELSFAAWTKSCEWADDDLLSHLLGNCLCCQLGISHEYKVYTVNLIQLHLLLQTYMTWHWSPFKLSENWKWFISSFVFSKALFVKSLTNYCVLEGFQPTTN